MRTGVTNGSFRAFQPAGVQPDATSINSQAKTLGSWNGSFRTVASGLATVSTLQDLEVTKLLLLLLKSSPA